MIDHTFAQWLNGELTSTRCALLSLYEQRDRLLYIEGPRLEKEYMEKIGLYEEMVIREEIECEILEKKKQMIQIAINRREPIDESAIDSELEALRNQMINDAVGPEIPKEFADLDSDQMDELQSLYRDIVKNFHPQMYPDLTEAHRQLFEKAQEAYRHRDLAALKLIYDMLFGTVEDEMTLNSLYNFFKSTQDDDCSQNEAYAADYKLVAQIYENFSLTTEEVAVEEEWSKYCGITENTLNEINDLKQQFPYTRLICYPILLRLKNIKKNL